MSRMKVLRFELNIDGVDELRKCEAMQNILQGYADKKAAEAGEGYKGAVHLGKFRAYANVYPSNPTAWADNLDNNTLEKVIRT